VTDDYWVKERIHPFPGPEKAPPPQTLIAVLAWECPHCKQRNPYDDTMDNEVVACLSCHKLSRPQGASLNDATTEGQLANIRKMLDW